MGSFSFHKNFGFNPYKGKEPFFLSLSNFTHKSLHYPHLLYEFRRRVIYHNITCQGGASHHHDIKLMNHLTKSESVCRGKIASITKSGVDQADFATMSVRLASPPFRTEDVKAYGENQSQGSLNWAVVLSLASDSNRSKQRKTYLKGRFYS